MKEFFANNSEILAWAAPSALVLTATAIQWAYGWRRMLDKLALALDHKVEKEECMKIAGDKVEEKIFVEASELCLERIKEEVTPLWKSHNSLAKEVAGSTSQLKEAVGTLKDVVKEIRAANGKK